jgi:hypothetical protein
MSQAGLSGGRTMVPWFWPCVPSRGSWIWRTRPVSAVMRSSRAWAAARGGRRLPGRRSGCGSSGPNALSTYRVHPAAVLFRQLRNPVLILLLGAAPAPWLPGSGTNAPIPPAPRHLSSLTRHGHKS